MAAVKKKSAKKKTAVKKPTAKKKTTKKVASKKAVTKKAPAKKKTTKKVASKKAVTKKAPAKKKTTKKVASKKTVTKKAPAKKKTTKKVAKDKTTKKRKNSSLGPNIVSPYKTKDGESYMNAEQISHFRNLLQDWKNELMQEVDRTVHHLQDEAANFPDPNDRASQESDFALELRTRDRERKLIKKIEEAMINLENDDFGYCEACGIEIGVRRLEARPTATLCIDCKTLDEIREKQIMK